MNPLIEALTFDEAGKLANDGNEAARLYWACLGRLSTTKEYATWSPHDLHDEVSKVVREIYDKQQAEMVSGGSNNPKELFPVRSIVDYWVRTRAAQRLIQEGLLEEYKFSCVLLELEEPLASEIKAFARQRIPENHLVGKGYEERPHITLKYGLHTTRAEDVRRVLNQHSGMVAAQLGRLELFTESPDYDVVVIAVESRQLRELHRLLSTQLACTDTHPLYRPHITLAYVQKGAEHHLKGDATWDGRRVHFREAVFTTPAGAEERLPLVEHRTFSRHQEHTNPTTRARSSGRCELCGTRDELRDSICFRCFAQDTDEATQRAWFLSEETTPDELAEKPPLWIALEYRPVWAHLVKTRRHTTYAAAVAHFKRHVFRHGLTSRGRAEETLSTALVGATTARPVSPRKSSRTFKQRYLIAPLNGLGKTEGKEVAVSESIEELFPDYHQVLVRLGFKPDNGQYTRGHQAVVVYRDGGWIHHGEGKGGSGDTLAELIAHLERADGRVVGARLGEAELRERIRHEGGKWVIYSKKGKRLGVEKSEAAAKRRLRQIEYFKHKKKEDLDKRDSGVLAEDHLELGDRVRTVEGLAGTVIHIHNYGTPAEAYVVRHGQGQVGLYRPGELLPLAHSDEHQARGHLAPFEHPMGRTIPPDADLETF